MKEVSLIKCTLAISHQHKNYSSWSKQTCQVKLCSLQARDGFEGKKEGTLLAVRQFWASTVCPEAGFSALILERTTHTCDFIHTHIYALYFKQRS